MATHLGAVRAGLLRVGDELPAVESRVEGFFDGVGQGLLLLTAGAKARSVAWARGESWLVGAPELDSEGRREEWDRAGATGRGRIPHLCAHIDVPGVTEDA